MNFFYKLKFDIYLLKSFFCLIDEMGSSWTVLLMGKDVVMQNIIEFAILVEREPAIEGSYYCYTPGSYYCYTPCLFFYFKNI
jgi:hypothetical protein